jgi:hypothetical protein
MRRHKAERYWQHALGFNVPQRFKNKSEALLPLCQGAEGAPCGVLTRSSACSETRLHASRLSLEIRKQAGSTSYDLEHWLARSSRSLTLRW